MRQIINLSLPSEMATAVNKEIKKGVYASKSEFFRTLLRAWMEDKLLLELSESKQDITQGKGKVLRSLRDLR